MANKKNKVKFGLTNVHYAKIKDWVTDASGANLTPVYVDPVRLPGAVSISIDANGENENFYADDIVYYVISNNSGYEGDLEIALIPTDFSTDIPVRRFLINGEKSWTATVFWWNEMMMRYHSLRCCLNSPEISGRFAMFFTAVPPPVQQQRDRLPRTARK